MHSDTTFHVNPISPYDLDVIDSVFRAELRKRKLSRCSEEAEQLAARLISLYQAGRRDAHELSAAVADAMTTTNSVHRSSQQEKSRSPC
jgi:putative salt-induced outer membrane protein YdiY